jgi:vacuolar protein sorting-associated protein 1
VKQQIKRLEDPALKCCQLVYDELIRILGQLLTKIVRFLTVLCVLFPYNDIALSLASIPSVSRAARAL